MNWDEDFSGDGTPSYCFVHEWVSVLLVRSVVYHCAKCGKKKEEYEEEQKQEEAARRRYNENWD